MMESSAHPNGPERREAWRLEGQPTFAPPADTVLFGGLRRRAAFWSSASPLNEQLELSRGLARRNDRMHYVPDGEYFRAAHRRPAKQQNDDRVGSAR